MDVDACLPITHLDYDPSFDHIPGNQLFEHETYLTPVDFHDASPLNIPSPESTRFTDGSRSIIPEHCGPGFWLSLCSDPGLAWTRSRVGHDGFAEIAEELTATWTKQLRLERNESTIQNVEPREDLAWKYCNAYFEQSVDSLFGVVYRPEFEHRLRAYLRGEYDHDDPSWYALRNVVFATGCRIYHSGNPAATFAKVQEEAWSYFSNSLSVHSELLLRSPNLRAVRALLAMALFAEGLGSPALGSGLIANAALLAQSLGLHRKFANMGSTMSSETLQRTWLFWSVYCSEKNIAQRYGRPSVIEDDDISCQIPVEVHEGSTIDLKVLTHIIQSCRLSGKICRQLMFAKALDERPERMLEMVNDFDKQLRIWKASLPSQIRPQECLKQFQPAQNAKMLAIILLHCSYYNLLMVVHTLFAYPWITAFENNRSETLRAKIKAQIDSSSNIVANAARNIIVITRNFDIDGACTHAFMLHYPMHAFINLFVHVLKSPNTPTVRSDLALLDVGAGYFGQMDFLTSSKLSFPFARDIVTLARQVVDGVKSPPSTDTITGASNTFQERERMPLLRL